MKKIYQLAFVGNAAKNNIEMLPMLADGDETEKYTLTDTNLSWFTTDNSEDDNEKNLQNWGTVLEMLDLKKESDIENVVFIAGSASPMILEILSSRRAFLDQLSQQKNVGPKRLKMISDALKIWFPVITKCAPGEEFFDTWKETTRTNTTNKTKYIFVRWACV